MSDSGNFSFFRTKLDWNKVIGLGTIWHLYKITQALHWTSCVGQKKFQTYVIYESNGAWATNYRSFWNGNPLLPDHNNGVKPENRLCNVHRWWIQDIFELLASILLKGPQILSRLYCRGWDGHLGYVQQL